jgi:hypothetical protein
MSNQVAPVEQQTERKLAASAPIARNGGRAQLMPRDLAEATELAKLLSKAEGMVGPHLLGNPGACLGIVIQAMEWGISPYQVAMKSYVASKPKPGEAMPPISFEAQLIHAVVLRNAPLDGRLSHEYIGEGDGLRCRVWGTFVGASSPSELTSETLKRLIPPKNDYGKLKGSPLWLTKPRQQLFYNTVRDWARMFCPDVILGAYSSDEMVDYEEHTIEPATIDPFAGEGPKLPAKGGEGFQAALPATYPDAGSSLLASVNSEAVEPVAPVSVPYSSSDAPPASVPCGPSEAGLHSVAGAPSAHGAPAIKSAAGAARWAGESAFAARVPEDANPYEENSPLWLAWLEGYHGGAK